MFYIKPKLKDIVFKLPLDLKYNSALYRLDESGLTYLNYFASFVMMQYPLRYTKRKKELDGQYIYTRARKLKLYMENVIAYKVMHYNNDKVLTSYSDLVAALGPPNCLDTIPAVIMNDILREHFKHLKLKEANT